MSGVGWEVWEGGERGSGPGAKAPLGTLNQGGILLSRLLCKKQRLYVSINKENNK